MKKVTGKIVQKYTSKGLQPANGKFMFYDFPFKRPVNYHLEIEGGFSTEVSHAEYEELSEGDFISFEVMEAQDWAVVGLIALIFVAIVVIGGIIILP